MKTPWARVFGYRTQKGKDENAIADLLSRVPIFEDLNKKELAAVERILHRREYNVDEVIFRQDEPGMGMYIVQSGTVAILSEPTQMLLSELKDGDFFGEVALLDESPRSATAIARTPCSVFGFFQPDLFGLLERDPRLGIKIVLRLARFIGARLRKTNEQALSLSGELETLKKSLKPRSK